MERIKLSWQDGFGSVEDVQHQAALAKWMYSLDTVFEVGETGEDGATWHPDLIAIKDSESDYSILKVGTFDPKIIQDQYSGAWCSDGDGIVLGKIKSHTASYFDALYSAYVIMVDWYGRGGFHTSSTECHIGVYRRYRIDKSQPFSPVSPLRYAPGLLPNVPVQYDLTLMEVDE